jgi:methyl-accepting chemotaxis protein
VTPSDAAGREYQQFWADLRAGRYQAAEYKRVGKGGKDVWIQASYNPVLDASGKPIKIVKYATDITDAKLRNADYQGQLAAIGKAQAVIEFDLDGTIRTANENFLVTLGYRLDEVQGRHHRMFVTPAFGASREYQQFWADLAAGTYQAGEYKRVGKGGKEVWIQASYNPILDMSGRPFKVVKYATDVTAAKLQAADAAGQLAAIGKSQAVIEFALDGTIASATGSTRFRASTTACSWSRRMPPAASTSSSGQTWPPARTRPASTSVWPRAGGKCGFRRRTTRSST